MNMKMTIGKNISDIDKESHRRPEQQHGRAADAGAQEHAQLAARGIEPHRALQIFAPDDVVNDQLAARPAEHTGHAVDDQQDARVPHLIVSVRNKIAQVSETLAYIICEAWIILPAIVPIGERAEIDREK